MKKRIFQWIIDLVAALLPGRRATLSVVRFVGLFNRPMARNHLKHYLSGGGQSLPVSTARLLKEDMDVRQWFLQAVGEALGNGQVRGAVPVPQSIYAHPDWRCALGAIQLDWQRDRDGIVVGFEDRYCWKPDEDRVTRGIHRVAEAMKRDGAREFMMQGLTTRISLRKAIEAATSKPLMKPDRLLL
ncbi:MAG: hypothetical protein AAF492_25270 [Verrucomicrobiota bacterium]